MNFDPIPYLQALMAWRPGTTSLWILGCLAAWVVIVFLITRLIPRPTPADDAEQAKAVSRPGTLDDGIKWLSEYRERQQP